MITASSHCHACLDVLCERGVSTAPELVAPERVVDGGCTAVSECARLQCLPAIRLLANTLLANTLPQWPEAVLPASDRMAVGAVRAAKFARFRLPEAGGTTAFEDLPFAASSDPTLTTLRQPIQPFVATAAQGRLV